MACRDEARPCDREAVTNAVDAIADMLIRTSGAQLTFGRAEEVGERPLLRLRVGKELAARMDAIFSRPGAASINLNPAVED
jgi:hypothetical protein